ncbi:MAG TPA: methylated-DNA--[protein]-cysteine S-methyltransferase [Candidatus Paceibacterota bacterium]|nr:methylated-DNA--[protein]-cysteine S-methyltransferase [Candidatus Paceibacterota bacterium]HRZ55846.1 methylated-DNA--[protein]-cysteine S-methyltransferase [Candidatus Paceibacterota bacterium]
MPAEGDATASALRVEFEEVFGRDRPDNASISYRRVVLLETPLGPMLAAASDRAVCWLEFARHRELERSRAEMQRRFGVCMVSGANPVLDRLRVELRDYFRGTGRAFTVPIEMRGTEFQERVWGELQRIPYGATSSYEAVAQRIGSPTGARAVARANATNRLCLIVPCHRVIAKSGALSGYSGGVWRKPLLLELEGTGRLPRGAAPIKG